MTPDAEKRKLPHRWKKGEIPPGAKPWKPGQSGNPAGFPRGPSPRTRSIQRLMDIADEIMASDEAQEAFRNKFRECFLANPAKALREYIYPLTPQVKMTAEQTGSGDIVRRMTITQLKELASELDSDPGSVGDKLIEIPPETTESPQAKDDE